MTFYRVKFDIQKGSLEIKDVSSQELEKEEEDDLIIETDVDEEEFRERVKNSSKLC